MSSETEERLERLVEATNPRILISVLKGELLTAWEELEEARAKLGTKPAGITYPPGKEQL